jgi:two-component system chemotaxis sensor kinase CheA
VDAVDEIVQEFLVESHENLDQLDRDLVALEQRPGARELLSSIFRTVHTIKGTSGFLAFNQLEAVTHVGEGLLSKLRDGERQLTPQITTALLDMVDAVRALLATIEATGGEGDPDYSELVDRLTQLLHDDQPAAAPAAAHAALPAPEPADRLGEVLVTEGDITPDDVTLALAAQDLGDERPVGEILVEQGSATRQDVADALEVQADSRRSVADSSIRVDVDLLDSLMNLVGELVLTRNQIVQKAAARADSDLLRTSHRLNLIAGELQEGVMKTRMQPIDNVWSKLPRVVRDLSVQLGKTILEAIKDPLTHLVRNSVDHGVEPTERRLAAGKPAEGTLLLRAFHEGGQVNIEISDDGAGIDPEKIRAKAVSRGLVGRDVAQRMATGSCTR